MFFSIVRDAVTLFLLLYAVIDLGNRLVAFLSHVLVPEKCPCRAITVFLLSECSCQSAEYQIRTLLKQHRNILLIQDACDEETALIAQKLADEFEYVKLLSLSDFVRFITPQKKMNVYEAVGKEADLNLNK